MSSDSSREAKIAVAMTYLQHGLIEHDIDRVLLGPDAHRINNGKLSCPDPESLGAIILREPVAAIHNLRWVVDGDDAVVVYDLLTDWTRSEQSDTFADPSTWVLAFIGERFHIVDGMIHEIEVLYAPSDSRHEPLERPARTPPPSDTAPSRDEVIAICQTYMDALFSGDGASVLLAPDAWRIENGRDMGDTGLKIQEMLTQMLGDGPKLVTGIDDLRWYVEGEEAVAFYTLEIDPSAIGDGAEARADARGVEAESTRGVGQVGAELVQMPIVERFRVHDGLITEVEPVIPGWID